MNEFMRMVIQAIKDQNIELAREKKSHGDCIMAATGLINKVEFIITEDQHFEQIKEVKARKLEETRI